MINPPIKIRKATVRDCLAVRRIAKTPELANPGGETPGIAWFKSLTKNRGVFLVATLKNKIVGFILGEKLQDKGAMIWLIGVKKNMRGKGIGHTLLNAFEATCNKQKRSFFCAYGYAKNPVILKLLKKHGFTQGELYYEFLKLPN